MGLLDDAIREHLALKRRHGADPSEVERQEHEALGPARRGAAPPTDEAEDEAGAVSANALADQDDEPAGAPYDDDDAGESVDGDDDEPEPSVPAGEPEAPVAPPAPPPPQDRADDPAVLDADDVPDLEPEPPPEPELAAGDSEGREDVLEETPDFLQETPEHDRLWFEQKPPRDFEF